MPALIKEGPVWTLDLGGDENRFSPTSSPRSTPPSTRSRAAPSRPSC
ncbi:hypothetical protein [Nocardioides daphniae]|nr:hypothetical protein [Nocardioides daphniae]